MRPEQDDPASRVERAFAAIAATRMAGLPLCNPALAVEACGFRPWNGLWLGVLVTPWAINLMLLPDGNPAFRRLGADQRQTWTFPSGDYAFHGAEAAALGSYQTCSLFSPAFEFAGQEAARQAAHAALDALLASPPAAPTAAARPMSRRAFLAGLRAGGREA
jgi:[NiFe] hydrogenase assembly HybE family chaperone